MAAKKQSSKKKGEEGDQQGPEPREDAEGLEGQDELRNAPARRGSRRAAPRIPTALAYWAAVEGLKVLGVGQMHPFDQIVLVKKQMGDNWRSFAAKEARSAETGKDAEHRILQNVSVIAEGLRQATPPFGTRSALGRLRQVGGAVQDRWRMNRGGHRRWLCQRRWPHVTAFGGRRGRCRRDSATGTIIPRKLTMGLTHYWGRDTETSARGIPQGRSGHAAGHRSGACRLGGQGRIRFTAVRRRRGGLQRGGGFGLRAVRDFTRPSRP